MNEQPSFWHFSQQRWMKFIRDSNRNGWVRSQSSPAAPEYLRIIVPRTLSHNLILFDIFYLRNVFLGCGFSRVLWLLSILLLRRVSGDQLFVLWKLILTWMLCYFYLVLKISFWKKIPKKNVLPEIGFNFFSSMSFWIFSDEILHPLV